MKVKIETKLHLYYYKGEYTYDKIISELKSVNLPIIEGQFKSKRKNCIAIYTELNSLDDLNKLVKAFGCHIVYGNKDKDGTIIIEKI